MAFLARSLRSVPTRSAMPAVAAVAIATACIDSIKIPFADLECSIPRSDIIATPVGRDGIPALTNPKFVPSDDPEAAYLVGKDRVIGMEFDGQAIAVPLNIGWWHEIVNLEAGGLALAITHCPLTGSSLAFDRTAIGGAGFGVSGMLYMNNLLMYDRRDRESLWPQMLREGRCGPSDGVRLDMVPALEATWEGWLALHPGTLVVSSALPHGRDYTWYPYGRYDQIDNTEVAFPMPRQLDRRRPLKERVLGIPVGNGGLAFPFGALDEAGAQTAVHAALGSEPIVIFWDRFAAAAMAYHRSAGDETLTFEVVDGLVRDEQTGSVWRVDGRASEGALEGTRLEPVAEAFVAFWFAWAAFYPETELWTGS